MSSMTPPICRGLSLAEAAKTAVGSLRGVPDMLKAGDFDGVRWDWILSGSVWMLPYDTSTHANVGGGVFG